MRRILWFRRDLRVEDQPLLSLEGDVLPIFIFDTHILTQLNASDRRLTFIFDAVMSLKKALRALELDLAIFFGTPSEVFDYLLRHEQYDEVCASLDYDSYAAMRDRDISHKLPFHAVHDTYIFHPEEVMKPDFSPYLVFTPYYNRAKALFHSDHMTEIARSTQTLIPFAYDGIVHILNGDASVSEFKLSSIGFIPQKLTSFQQNSPAQKLKMFLSKISTYQDDRDVPALDATSGLSLDLRFGTISIRAVLRWLIKQKNDGINTEPFFRELIFREFYAMLLFHFPHLTGENFRYRFKGIEDQVSYQAFCTGNTGVPIVDAGIRQLLKTGDMHNRVRMITASFLTKNLLLPWQWGEAFFANHLMDYDAASNILSWQWSAGTGVDPQPYFRIFNPYVQAKKFDSEGKYIRRWVSELADIPSAILHDEKLLRETDIPNYPKPIVDHKVSAKKALEHFKSCL